MKQLTSQLYVINGDPSGKFFLELRLLLLVGWIAHLIELQREPEGPQREQREHARRNARRKFGQAEEAFPRREDPIPYSEVEVRAAVKENGYEEGVEEVVAISECVECD